MPLEIDSNSACTIPNAYRSTEATDSTPEPLLNHSTTKPHKTMRQRWIELAGDLDHLFGLLDRVILP